MNVGRQNSDFALFASQQSFSFRSSSALAYFLIHDQGRPTRPAPETENIQMT